MQLKRDDNGQGNTPQQGGVNQPNEYYTAGQAGQSPYGQPSQSPYGQAGQSPYGQPGQSSYGQPSQSPYGQPGQTPYGQPNQSSYGQPNDPYRYNDPYARPNDPYSQPVMQGGYSSPVIESKSSIPSWLIGVIVIALIGVAVYLIFFSGLLGKRFTPGKVSGNKFKNEYFGVEIDGGTDSTMMGYTGSDEKKELENQFAAVNEMIMTTNKGEVLIFSVLNAGRDIKGSGYTDSAIMDEMESTFKTTIASSGYSGTKVERDTITIKGKVLHGFQIEAGTDYGKAYCVQYYVFLGKYVGIFTSVAYSKSRATTILTEHVKKCSGE